MGFLLRSVEAGQKDRCAGTDRPADRGELFRDSHHRPDAVVALGPLQATVTAAQVQIASVAQGADVLAFGIAGRLSLSSSARPWLAAPAAPGLKISGSRLCPSPCPPEGSTAR